MTPPGPAPGPAPVQHRTPPGPAGTAFGIANSIAISNINTQLSKEIHRTNMLVDVTQLHENHLHNID